MRADEKLKIIMKWVRFIITLMNIVPMLNAQIFITNKHDSDNQSQIRNNSLYYFFVYWYSCSCRILLLIFMRYVFLHCFIQGFKLGYNILSKTLVFRLMLFPISCICGPVWCPPPHFIFYQNHCLPRSVSLHSVSPLTILAY